MEKAGKRRGAGRPYSGPGVALLMAVLLAACNPMRAGEAMRLLEDIAAGHGPSAYKESRPAPRRTAVAYRQRGRDYAGDLYVSGTRPEAAAPAPGIILVPGLAPQGKDDPRLTAFAASLARAGFQVLVPDLPSMRALQAGPENAVGIADAVLELADRMAAAADAEDRAGIGLVAVSYAVGPAVLAALEPATEGRIDYLFGIGGYYDLPAVVAFFTTGRYRERPDGTWRYREPNVYGRWVFVLGNADRVEDPQDRARLRAMARRRIDDPAADIDDLTAGLGAEGRAVYALLQNQDPERVPALIDALPAAMRRDIAELDLSRQDLSRLEPRLILVHGRDDAIIPWSESARLAEAVPAGRADLYLADSLAHVDIGDVGIGDALVLMQATYRLLEERDR